MRAIPSIRLFNPAVTRFAAEAAEAAAQEAA